MKSTKHSSKEKRVDGNNKSNKKHRRKTESSSSSYSDTDADNSESSSDNKNSRRSKDYDTTAKKRKHSNHSPKEKHIEGNKDLNRKHRRKTESSDTDTSESSIDNKNNRKSRDYETSAKTKKHSNHSLKEKLGESNKLNKKQSRKRESSRNSSSDTDADSESSSNNKNSRRNRDYETSTKKMKHSNDLLKQKPAHSSKHSKPEHIIIIDEETSKRTKRDEHSVFKKPRRISRMWKIAIPDNILEKLKCCFCEEYLSQLPIYSYQGQDGVACGRCPVLSEQNPIRDVCYEAVAQYLLFPCRYKPYGCLENVLPMHMRSHEESCLYKQYFCPFIPLASCPWQGPSNELFAHYEDQHKVLALHDSTFEIDLVNMYEDNYLLTHGEELFIIHVKCDAKENAFWCSVRYIGSKKMADQFLFQLELKKHNGIENIKFPKKSIDCDGNINLDKNTAVHIDAADIKKALDDPYSIICNIKILPNEPDFTNIANGSNGTTSTTTIATEDIDEDLLRELECPVCNEYMVPPIHQCVAGHSICSVCKTQVGECPTCRNRIEDTRNYSLENMTRLIKYRCKYRDFDCPFVSTSDKIRQHEAECKFGPYECPFRGYNQCKWKGKLDDIMDHAKREHEDNILEIDVVTFPFEDDCVEDEDDDCFIMKAYGETFKLIFKYETSTFYWSVQYIGPAEDSHKYMFELDIVDCSDSTQRFFMKLDCNPLTKHEEAFNNEASFIQLPVQTLKRMMNGCDLVYKCHVVKK